MATDTASRLLATAQGFRDDLEALNVDASTTTTRAWLIAQQRVELEVQSLLAKMEAARLAGVTPSPAWLYQERRLSSLTDSIADQVRLWAATAEPAIRDAAYAAAAQAQQNAQALSREAASVDLPGVEASFTDLAPENMASILGHLAPGGPLRDLLYSIGGETVEAAVQALLQGTILGKGTDWVAREMGKALDIPRWRAETIARTEVLRSYRETSRETYKASNVVGSWTWTSALDRRTCPACVALHGRRFSLEEQLDGHPRCRCAMVPNTKSWAEIDPSLGEGQEVVRTATPDDLRPGATVYKGKGKTPWEVVDVNPNGQSVGLVRAGTTPRSGNASYHFSELTIRERSPGLDAGYAPVPPMQTGAEWLKAQSPLTQKAILGPGKYDLYANGKADLPDFVARTHSPAWGTMRRERSLKELAEGRNADYRDLPPEQTEDDIWEALAREEAERNAAEAAKRATTDAMWDRWETGRDRRVYARQATPEERASRLAARDQAKEWADRDAETLAIWEQRVKDRQAELRQYVPDAKERAKVARTDLTLKSAKEQVAYMKTQAAASADNLRRAQEGLDAITRDYDLPDFNPDNPLEFYGDRIKFHDHSASSQRWARDLEEHLDPIHHQALRDHFADSDHGGIYMGDKSVPHLDSLGDELPSGETPRGYTDGKTYDDCHGVYSPLTRVVGCGHASHGLDAHHSTVLHEAGHALDFAYGQASSSTAWRAAYDAIPADVQRSMIPYYQASGNATGYLSEAWAEGFQAWTRVRFQPLEVQARELGVDLVTGLRPLTDSEVQAMIPLARYYSDLYASRRVLP